MNKGSHLSHFGIQKCVKIINDQGEEVLGAHHDSMHSPKNSVYTFRSDGNRGVRYTCVSLLCTHIVNYSQAKRDKQLMNGNYIIMTICPKGIKQHFTSGLKYKTFGHNNKLHAYV